MTYVLLIYTSREGALSPEANARTLEAHRGVQAEAAARGELHAVAKLGGTAGARTVRRASGQHDLIDGPFLETKERLVGFYLVDCADEAKTLARARAICPSDDYAIEVRPAEWIWRRGDAAEA